MESITEQQIFEAMGKTQDGGAEVLKNPKNDDFISRLINHAVKSFDNEDIGELYDNLGYAVKEIEKARESLDKNFELNAEIER